MARGKYASAADARQARESAQSEVVRLERECQRLRSETDRLDRENLAQQAAHVSTTAHLRSLMAQGTSERLQQVEADLAEMTTQRDEVIADLGYKQRTTDRLFDKFQEYYCSQGNSVSDFYEFIGLADGGELTVVPASMNVEQARKLGEVAMRRIKKARGE